MDCLPCVAKQIAKSFALAEPTPPFIACGIPCVVVKGGAAIPVIDWPLSKLVELEEDSGIAGLKAC